MIKSPVFKVGLFTLLGLVLLGVVTVYVNDRPYWWRSCELVHITIEDATGLKPKSPVRSLGLDIGYLKTVELSETSVRLGICITAPVEVLPGTRAYIRAEGFLGDKFVELKPVKYLGPPPSVGLWDLLVPSVYAQEEDPATARPSPSPRAPGPGGREIPVGTGSQDVSQVVTRVDSLVNEMTKLTQNIRDAVNPEELRDTMRQLNKTLENASRTLAPEGNLNTTAQRALAKLEDAIEQLRDMVTRVNKGEGSVGMILNDPTYAEEMREAIRNVNRLLSKVSGVRFVVDVGAEHLTGYNDARGWFRLMIWPTADRYYNLGASLDPRGKRSVVITTVEAGSVKTETKVTTVEESGILLTGMLGKVFFERLDLSLGILHGDGTVSAAIRFGPAFREHLIQLRSDTYVRGGAGLDDRLSVVVSPWHTVYVRGGLEGFRKVDGKYPLFVGAGISFDDEDIKLLFALR